MSRAREGRRPMLGDGLASHNDGDALSV